MSVCDQVFISYCHRDRTWLDSLQTHLRPLVRDGALDLFWHDAGNDGRTLLHALVTNQPPQASPAVCKRLREQEILDNDNRFLVPMVQTWIGRRCQVTDANLPT